MRRIASHLYTLLEHTVHSTHGNATTSYIDTHTCGPYLRALASKKRHLLREKAAASKKRSSDDQDPWAAV